MTTDRPQDTVDPLDVATVIVSADSHAGPTLDQLREYCEAKYLPQFDAFANEDRARKDALSGTGFRKFVAVNPNLQTAGHNDPYARLRDMDADGVAVDVIYHNSANGEVMPFVPALLGGLSTVPTEAFEMAAVGYHIYNRWLADFVSVEPARHIGLAHVPTWDIEATVNELEWARDAGLRGVNFPPPGRPGQLDYNDLAWEPFWSACEDMGMALSTHASGGLPSAELPNPGSMSIAIWEGGGFLSRRGVWHLIFGEVFERHPKLNLILAEQYQGWWATTLEDLDRMCDRFSGPMFLGGLKKRPSEYALEHVYLGASFPSVALAQEAVELGYSSNVIWGSDYPHLEGTYQYPSNAVYPEGSDEHLVTRTALRHVFSQVPQADAVAMAGQNGVRAYGLDGDELAEIATRIGAVTLRELMTPPQGIPEVPDHCNAFRGPFNAR